MADASPCAYASADNVSGRLPVNGTGTGPTGTIVCQLGAGNLIGLDSQLSSPLALAPRLAVAMPSTQAAAELIRTEKRLVLLQSSSASGSSEVLTDAPTSMSPFLPQAKILSRDSMVLPTGATSD